MPPTGRHKFFQLVVRRDGERLGDLTLTSSAQLGPFAATTLQGRVECLDENVEETLSGTFAAGWHLAPRRVEAVTPEGGERSHLGAGALPSGLAWRLYQEYGGVGLTFRPGPGGETVVDTVRPGLPAARAGVQPGDVLVTLDSQSLAGVPFAHVLPRIRGAAGTTVRLGVQRNGEAGPRVFALLRERVRLP